MHKVNDRHTPPVVIAVMGITGTGKSTFIHLLTRGDTINIGYGPTSETSTARTAQFVDRKTGRTIVLIDTPGFDDSREGITDMDVLEMISRTLGGEGRLRPKLNGLIYMHRISDPRVSGASLKNLRMFRALCGDENLPNVRIVTTNWGRVGAQEGRNREEVLANEIFKPLLDGRAGMLRYENNLASAEKIISEFIPLPPITTQLERELRAGKKLNTTSAGAVLTEEVAKQWEKHAEELADLQKEMEEAEKANDRAWQEELEQERRELYQMMEKAESDRRRLEMTLTQLQPEVRALHDSASLRSARRSGTRMLRGDVRRPMIGQGGARVDHMQVSYSRELQGREREWRMRQDTVQPRNIISWDEHDQRSCPTGCVLM